MFSDAEKVQSDQGFKSLLTLHAIERAGRELLKRSENNHG